MTQSFYSAGDWKFENLTLVGIKGLKYNSAGDWEFEDSTLARILKFNSAGGMYFKVLAPLGIWMMFCRGFFLE